MRTFGQKSALMNLCFVVWFWYFGWLAVGAGMLALGIYAGSLDDGQTYNTYSSGSNYSEPDDRP